MIWTSGPACMVSPGGQPQFPGGQPQLLCFSPGKVRGSPPCREQSISPPLRPAAVPREQSFSPPLDPRTTSRIRGTPAGSSCPSNIGGLSECSICGAFTVSIMTSVRPAYSMLLMLLCVPHLCRSHLVTMAMVCYAGWRLQAPLRLPGSTAKVAGCLFP